MLTNEIFFDIILSVVEIIYGEMSERLKEPVLKTGDVRASVGSNPTLSSKKITPIRVLFFWLNERDSNPERVFA